MVWKVSLPAFSSVRTVSLPAFWKVLSTSPPNLSTVGETPGTNSSILSWNGFGKGGKGAPVGDGTQFGIGAQAFPGGSGQNPNMSVPAMHTSCSPDGHANEEALYVTIAKIEKIE